VVPNTMPFAHGVRYEPLNTLINKEFLKIGEIK